MEWKNLSEKCELFNPERSSGGESIESKINSGSAMRVPTATVAAVGPGFLLLRHHRDLATVKELKHQHENLVSDRVHRDHTAGSSVSRGSGAIHALRRKVGPAEEFPKEKAPGGKDATMRVNQTPLHAEGNVAKGLTIDE